MNKNSYVTAALFAVFVLLTVVYWNMPNGDTNPGLIGTEMAATDLQSAGDIIESEEDASVGHEEVIEGEEGHEVGADVEEEEIQENVVAEDVNGEMTSSLQALRSEQARQRSQQVASLHEIIASADHDATTKSAAKDQIQNITQMTNSQHNLETIIRTKGFSDVLVRADEDAVRVAIQVSDLESTPSREELAELYVLAGIEFGSQRISIVFEPLN